MKKLLLWAIGHSLKVPAYITRTRDYVHDMQINGYFMLRFDLTHDRGASEAHTSLTEHGNIRIELQFSQPLPDSITCLLYLEYISTGIVNFSRKVTTEF